MGADVCETFARLWLRNDGRRLSAATGSRLRKAAGLVFDRSTAQRRLPTAELSTELAATASQRRPLRLRARSSMPPTKPCALARPSGRSTDQAEGASPGFSCRLMPGKPAGGLPSTTKTQFARVPAHAGASLHIKAEELMKHDQWREPSHFNCTANWSRTSRRASTSTSPTAATAARCARNCRAIGVPTRHATLARTTWSLPSPGWSVRSRSRMARCKPNAERTRWVGAASSPPVCWLRSPCRNSRDLTAAQSIDRSSGDQFPT